MVHVEGELSLTIGWVIIFWSFLLLIWCDIFVKNPAGVGRGARRPEGVLLENAADEPEGSKYALLPAI